MIETLPTLHVILRTHSTGNFHADTKRLTDEYGGKQELALRTLRSLIRGLKILDPKRVRLTVGDDHSDTETVRRMQALLSECNFPAALVSLQDSGNKESLRFAFEEGRRSREELCYFVEDDYLHEETALLEMLETYQICKEQMARSDIALSPVDNIWHYGYAGKPIVPTHIVLGTHRHWRTIPSTPSTFMLPRNAVEKYWEYMIRGVDQETYEFGMSTNYMWENLVPMLSPIPTLAYHVHDITDTPPFTERGWKRLWDSLAQ